MAPREKPVVLTKPVSDDSSPSSTSNTSLGLDLKERDRHDYFNLLVLPIIMAAIWPNWDLGLWIRERTSLQESWNDLYVPELIATVELYFLVDLLWVSFIPSCVKSPGTIVKHHIVAMIYTLCPLRYPEYGCYMGILLSVELNTWFLILRRVLFVRKETHNVPPFLRDLVDFAFYSSWILIRVVAYNKILWDFIPMLAKRYEMQVEVVLPTLFVTTQAILNVMQLKWTYDLFLPIVKRNLLGKGDKKDSGNHTL